MNQKAVADPHVEPPTAVAQTGADTRPKLDREFTVDLEGAELWIGTIGEGTPLLVLHGFGLDHSYLRNLDDLRDRVMVVYYDMRGNGRSPLTGSRTDFSFADDVADVDAVREGVEADKVLLFGHSWGGRIAQEYAVEHPDRVGALVLCATDARFDYAEVAVRNAHARGTTEEVAAVERLLNGMVTTDDEWASHFRTILPLYYYRREIARTDESLRDVIYSARSMRASLESLANFDMRDRLKDIEAPTLVLSGRDDWITPLEYGSRVLANSIPNAELVVFEESGHMPFIEERMRFIEVMRAWLGRVVKE